MATGHPTGVPEDVRSSEAIAAILAESLAVVGATGAMLYRVDRATRGLMRAAVVGFAEDQSPPAWQPMGVGLIGQCATTAAVVRSDDVAIDPRAVFVFWSQQAGAHAALILPLVSDGAVVGVVAVWHRERGYFSTEHAERLAAFVRQATPTIVVAWSQHERNVPRVAVDPRRSFSLWLRRVRELSMLVHRVTDLDAVFDQALWAMIQVTRAESALLALVDPTAGVIRGRRGLGMPPQLVAETIRPLTTAPTRDEDILSYVVRTGEPTLTETDDLRLNRDTAARYGLAKHGLTVPLLGRLGVQGTLSAGWNHDVPTQPELLEVVMILADHVAAAIDMHRWQRLIAGELQAIAQQVTSGLSLEQSLAAVLRAVEKLFGAASASIWLTNRPDHLPSRRYTTRFTGEPHWDERPSPLAIEGPLATLLERGHPYVIEDIQTDARYQHTAEEDTRTLAAVPIRYREQLVGVLYANWCERRVCSQDDLRLLETLAAYGGIAVENAQFHAREIEAARLDGVMLAARTAAHEINNDLAMVLGATEITLMQARAGKSVDLTILEDVITGAERAAWHVQQLQNVVRLERRLFRDLPPVLDLERSSEKPDGA